MKNDVQNESSEEENTDEPDKNKSVIKNQKGKGLPVRRIKKGSRKGSKVHREAERMIKEITSIKNNLDQNLKNNESAKKIQKVFREHRVKKTVKNEIPPSESPVVNNEKLDDKNNTRKSKRRRNSSTY